MDLLCALSISPYEYCCVALCLHIIDVALLCVPDILALHVYVRAYACPHPQVFVLSFALFLVPGYFPGGTSTAMEVSMAYVGGKG